ncbi:MAG TPA: hypothetical protein VGK67_41350 [Myxococcales bacterium]|jgi:hypothetical protein
MSAARIPLVLALAMLPSCALTTKWATLRPDGVLTAGSDVVVQAEIPGDWFVIQPAVNGSSAVGYLASDNYSGTALWVTRRGLGAVGCPDHARVAVHDATAAAMAVANRITATSRPILFDQYVWARLRPASVMSARGTPEIVADPAMPEVVDYRFDRITPGGVPPGPDDRFVQGRVMCRHGVLAVVSCSTGVERRETLGPICRHVLDSLAITPTEDRPAPAAAVPGP